MPLSKHIYLTGFMGAGKTSTGLALTQKLGMPYVDSDQELERRHGMSIMDIFLIHGEPFFRHAEHQLLLELAGNPVKKIISLGGGVILNPANRDILKSGHWIFLAATPATVMKRMASAHNRPLLGKKVGREDIEKLLQVRMPLYRLAPLQVGTDGLTPQAVANRIHDLLIPNP